jgi:hypothetical protein
VADRLPVICTVDLERFTAKLVLPIDVTWPEARRLSQVIEAQITDPSAAAKYAVSDPTIYPDVTI